MTTKDEKKITSEKPVPLLPLNFKEALGGLLKVKPKPKPKKSPHKKKKTQKAE